MGSNIKGIAVFLLIIMFAAVTGVVVYSNRGALGKPEEQIKAEEQSGIEVTDVGENGQMGSDTRAFLSDETFFDADKPHSLIDRKEGKILSMLMTSVEKDLRIQIVDSAGKRVTGINFCVVLNKDEEYMDEDKDGMIYVEHLRAGEYEVVLKEVEDYLVSNSAARIEVKQSIEYAVIDDISLLIFNEEDVNSRMEDLEVRGAQEDADQSEITKMQEGNPNARVGIDVSKWNQEIDWDKVKQEGVQFAIIRVGYRGAATGTLVADPYFVKNMEGAASAGIPVGVYFFTQAVNAVEAVEEASMVASLCGEYDLTYPVFIDTEGAGGAGRADGLDKETRTQVCKAFCSTIESAGYQAGIYAARNWFNQMLDMENLNDYIVWLAEYRDVPVYQGYYHMWQYTSGGKLDGIEGKVDFNLSYLKQNAEEQSTEVKASDDFETEDTEEEEPQEIVEPKAITGTENAEW